MIETPLSGAQSHARHARARAGAASSAIFPGGAGRVGGRHRCTTSAPRARSWSARCARAGSPSSSGCAAWRGRALPAAPGHPGGRVDGCGWSASSAGRCAGARLGDGVDRDRPATRWRGGRLSRRYPPGLHDRAGADHRAGVAVGPAAAAAARRDRHGRPGGALRQRRHLADERPADGDFDGEGFTYPAADLPPAGEPVHEGPGSSSPAARTGPGTTSSRGARPFPCRPAGTRKLRVLGCRNGRQRHRHLHGAARRGNTTGDGCELSDWTREAASTRPSCCAPRTGTTRPGRNAANAAIFHQVVAAEPGQGAAGDHAAGPHQPQVHIFALSLEKPAH